MKSSRISIVAVLAALTLAAGCGGDDGADAADAFTKQSGNEIAEAAKADMKALKQVKYAGAITSDGAPFDLDVQASSEGDCTGSIGVEGGSSEILSKDGEGWFRPDEGFWRVQAPDQAEAIIAAVGDKWVVDTDEQFTQFCDLDAFFDNIFSPDGSTGDYKKTGEEELDGQDVVKVEKSGDKGSATGYVLVEGEHYLLKLERTEGDSPGSLEFSEFNEEFEVEAPAEDQVVDLSQL